MQWLKELDRFLIEEGFEFLRDVPLAPYTTIKIGGPAKRVIFPRSKEELIKTLDFLIERQIPHYVIGGGSNLLVADSGFFGAVLILTKMKGFKIITEDGQTLVMRVLSGTKINEIIAGARKLGYGGFEFLAGVPATLGGAIRMNAGAFGITTSAFVRKVEIYEGNAVKEIIPSDHDWTYRSFKVPGIIISAELALPKTDEREIQRRLRDFWERRRRTQPVAERTFGSTFKNPPCCYAGALIEEVGLKGFRIGNAKISEKHANFIVNLGEAKAQDVLELIYLAKTKVYERFQILLEPEVKFLGIDNERFCN